MSTELKMSVYFGSGVVNSGGLKFFELTQIHFESQLVLFVVKTKFASSTDKYIFSFHVLIFLVIGLSLAHTVRKTSQYEN